MRSGTNISRTPRRQTCRGATPLSRPAGPWAQRRKRIGDPLLDALGAVGSHTLESVSCNSTSCEYTNALGCILLPLFSSLLTCERGGPLSLWTLVGLLSGNRTSASSGMIEWAARGHAHANKGRGTRHKCLKEKGHCSADEGEPRAATGGHRCRSRVFFTSSLKRQLFQPPLLAVRCSPPRDGATLLKLRNT